MKKLIGGVAALVFACAASAQDGGQGVPPPTNGIAGSWEIRDANGKPPVDGATIGMDVNETWPGSYEWTTWIERDGVRTPLKERGTMVQVIGECYIFENPVRGTTGSICWNPGGWYDSHSSGGSDRRLYAIP